MPNGCTMLSYQRQKILLKRIILSQCLMVALCSPTMPETKEFSIDEKSQCLMVALCSPTKKLIRYEEDFLSQCLMVALCSPTKM